MKIYLVGGAVRDELLGIPSKEKDWVVVDSSHQEMTKNGFKRVGKNFPVYIHPETKEEYALARKEKKTGKGHKNFSFDVNPNVSLSEDLKRRDITINAIAKDSLGNFYDPFGGMKDLKNRKIRIVSNAFSEDPLRLFRIARFKTKLAAFDFSITKNSLAVMKEITSNDEVNFLSGERIWDETYKALSCCNSSLYFSTLKKVDALKYFEGLDKVYSKNLKFLKLLDEKKNMVFEKWAIINLYSKEVDYLEKKIKVPKKICNFRKTFSLTKEMTKKKGFSEKYILSSLSKMNFFRNNKNIMLSLNLLEFLKIISKKELKDWSQLLDKLKKVKIVTKNLEPKEIKEKLLKQRITIIKQHKHD